MPKNKKAKIKKPTMKKPRKFIKLKGQAGKAQTAMQARHKRLANI